MSGLVTSTWMHPGGGGPNIVIISNNALLELKEVFYPKGRKWCTNWGMLWKGQVEEWMSNARLEVVSKGTIPIYNLVQVCHIIPSLFHIVLFYKQPHLRNSLVRTSYLWLCRQVLSSWLQRRHSLLSPRWPAGRTSGGQPWVSHTFKPNLALVPAYAGTRVFTSLSIDVNYQWLYLFSGKTDT